MNRPRHLCTVSHQFYGFRQEKKAVSCETSTIWTIVFLTATNNPLNAGGEEAHLPLIGVYPADSISWVLVSIRMPFLPLALVLAAVASIGDDSTAAAAVLDVNFVDLAEVVQVNRDKLSHDRQIDSFGSVFAREPGHRIVHQFEYNPRCSLLHFTPRPVLIGTRFGTGVRVHLMSRGVLYTGHVQVVQWIDAQHRRVSRMKCVDDECSSLWIYHTKRF